MKSLLVILMLMSASMSFAARIPTLEEFNRYSNLIMQSPSVASLISDIKLGKINPMTEIVWNNEKMKREIVSNPGRSSFASQVIVSRFDARKPLGNEQENLDLLNAIIQSGVNLNIAQTDNGDYQNNSLMDVATKFCSLSAVNLLIKDGANPSLEDFYWVQAFNNWYDAESDSAFEKNCFAVADLMVNKAQSLSMKTIPMLFFPYIDEARGSVGSFVNGHKLEGNLSANMKNALADNLGITLSERPSGDLPDETWFNDFKDVMATGIGQDYQERGITWWNKQSDVQRAWACYFSSFDETLTALHNLGYSDEELTTKSIGGSYIMKIFNKFPVYVFGPYCNSLK